MTRQRLLGGRCREGFNTASGMRSHVTRPRMVTVKQITWFQYRKRYEVTCDNHVHVVPVPVPKRFNTASGMRSHVTRKAVNLWHQYRLFQYRKRYEVTCDRMTPARKRRILVFQYRKRYEVTCDVILAVLTMVQALRFNTASGMRSHVTWTNVYAN